MDSVWAEYYKPLWEEYHIFGYAGGAGSDSEKAEGIEEKLAEYMTHTLQPNTDLEADYPAESIDFYDISITSKAVTDQTGLIDHQGELIRKEAVEYMKYHELADGLTLLLEKLSLLETPKKVSAVYEKKQAAEQELAKADKNILRLMELLDGIKTSKTGIQLDEKGKLLTTEYFAKMLCFAPVTMEAVRINHDAVFEAVKDRYANPANIFSQVKSELVQLGSITQELYQLRNEISTIYSAMEAVGSQLLRIEGATQSTETEQQLDSLNSEMEGLQEQLSQLHTREQELSDRKAHLLSSVQGRLNRMKNILQEMTPIVEEAECEVEQVIINATKSSYLIDEYEESLVEEEESLGEEIFKAMKETLTQMKQYSFSYEENESFYHMYDTLGINLMILKDGQEAIQRSLDYLKSEDYSSAQVTSEEALKELQGYIINSLTIDYSTLVLDTAKQKNPVKELSKLIQSGITGLIIDPDSISEKELTAKQLPSVEASIAKETIDFTSMITAFFEDALKGGEENEFGSLIYDFRDTTELSAGIEEGIDKITELLLYQEYLKEHFESYPIGDNELSGRKPEVLAYELEYLLVGKTTDRENLASVISRIVFLRMILDFVTVLGDKARCEEAKLAAVAIVGFTGLPMLINITQAALLMVWSFAEALVDTCALILGKQVPILKQNLILQFPELFLLNRSFLRTKAEAFTASKQLSFSYQDYLRMFLLIKNKKDLTCRSMDLMQENINLRYEETVRLKDCLFGFESTAEYSIDTKFIAIPFLQNYINHDIIGYQFSCKGSYSY
jgi:predicted  nucleic acid-binding Zn-ribbon protein